MKTYRIAKLGVVRREESYGSTPSVTYSTSNARFDRGLTVITDVTNGDFVTPNSQNFQTYRRTSISGYALTRGPGTYRLSIEGDLYNVGAYDVAVPDRSALLYNATLSDLNEQVRGSLDLSIDFAEAGKTRQMIRQAYKVVDFARGLKKSLSGTVANKWLEYQYGWKPLVSSVYGVFDELMEKSIARELTVTLRARRRLSETFNTTFAPEGYDTILNTSRNKYRQEIGVVLKPGAMSPSVANYTSLNPLSIAWELLPYSFVVDWFVNVGGYLRNAETAMIYGRSFVRGWSTYGYRSDQEINRSGSGPYYVARSKGSSTLCKKQRSKLTSYPSPRLPVLNTFGLGSTRLLSAAALLRQLLR